MVQVSTSKGGNRSPRTGDQARQLINELREAIISGALPPGETLRQDTIAERYKTSRMPVREAFRTLEAESLIQLVPNKGAVVAPLNISELQEVYEMRVSAETLALHLSLPEMSNTQIDQAAKIQDEIESTKLDNFGALNKEFHSTLYQPCGRQRLLGHIAGLNDVADRYLRFTIRTLSYNERSNSDHQELLEACRRRDEPMATAILTAHITDAGQALQQYLRNKLDTEQKKI